jgi:DNA-binding MarR family transcriptional regulator
MTAAGDQVQPRAKFIIGSENSVEPSLQNCLENVDISLRSEWDVLAFVCRHGVSLASIGQIASLVGYESSEVAGALDRLEHEKLTEHSRKSPELRYYRLIASTAKGAALLLSTSTAGRKGCRTAAPGETIEASPVRIGEKNNRLGLDSEGKWYV